MTGAFRYEYGAAIDLVSLPLDGATEAVSSRTKKPGHFAANKYKFYLVDRSYLLRARRFANLVTAGR